MLIAHGIDGAVAMNNCKHLKNRKGKPFCKLLNKEIAFSDCSGCTHKEYKQKKVYPLKQNKPITQRTSKQAKTDRKSVV